MGMALLPFPNTAVKDMGHVAASIEVGCGSFFRGV